MGQAGVPIVIGVTGHRDLLPEDAPRLKAVLSAWLHKLRKRCPHTEFICLSSLAEGADQLCASLALEQGMGLSVPLPLAREDYRQDFSGAALEEFDRLLEKADRVFVAPDLEGRGDGSRDYAYRQAGIYVARHCHVLLALWDGKPGVSGCGTAETVNFKLKRSYCAPDDALLTAPDEGVALAVGVRRGKAPGEAVDERPRLLENVPGTLAALLRDTDRFNKDAARPGKGFPVFEADTLTALGQGAERLNTLYMRADPLAVRYRDRHLLSIRLLCVLGALLVAAFLLYDELEQKWFLPLYGLLALCACALYGAARAGRYHSKYFEYRRFAETLRVQLNLLAAGLPFSAEDLMPWSQRVLSPWIREAMNTLPTGDEPAAPAAANVKALWMEDQLDYHQRTFQKNLRRAKRQSALSAAMLALTALYFAIVLVMEFFFPARMDAGVILDVSLRSLMKILLGLIPACTLVATSYYGKLSIQRNLRDGQRMIALYREALERYDDPATDRPRLLKELAREELVENGGWLTSTSENGAELPI